MRGASLAILAPPPTSRRVDMVRNCFASLTSACLVLFPVATASAWNSTGHRAVAVIAYRQLDDATKNRVVGLLNQHPAAVTLWASHPNNGADPDLNPLISRIKRIVNEALYPNLNFL